VLELIDKLIVQVIIHVVHVTMVTIYMINTMNVNGCFCTVAKYLELAEKYIVMDKILNHWCFDIFVA